MTCAIPVIPANTLRARMAARAKAERIPLSVDMEIISTCNYKCVHCYIAPCAHREDVMSVEQAKMIFRQLAEAGTLSLLLTGGEIFSHKQFKEIYIAAKAAGFIVALNTNGYFIGRKWADFLADLPPKAVSISVYGATKETYERVTGIPNSFERCMRAVELLVERGIKLDLKCPAFTLTVDEIPQMREWAKSLGIQFRFDTLMTPQMNGGAKPLDLQLAPERILELEKDIDPGLETLRRYAGPRVGGIREGAPVYQCGAGKTGFAINVHGGVTTCITSRQVVGNIFEQPFAEIWAALGNKVSRQFPVGHPCATCKFRSMCAGCPATVEQLTGLPEGYVQQYCKITHLQAYELGYHPSGVPRTVAEGIPAGVTTPRRAFARALPVIS